MTKMTCCKIDETLISFLFSFPPVKNVLQNCNFKIKKKVILCTHKISKPAKYRQTDMDYHSKV